MRLVGVVEGSSFTIIIEGISPDIRTAIKLVEATANVLTGKTNRIHIFYVNRQPVDPTSQRSLDNLRLRGIDHLVFDIEEVTT